MVHRLVAFTFLENDDPKHKTVVNHLDKNKLNNNADNLEWTTLADNSRHGKQLRINMINPKTNKIVRTFNCLAEANEYVGRTKRNEFIRNICKGKEEIEIYRGHKWAFAK
jgi:hypothetical protein